MRNKLALTLALAVLAAVLGGGLASGAGPLGLNLPSVNLGPCADGVDNDGDGKVDLGDPDCVASAGSSEDSGHSVVPVTPPSTGGGGTTTTPGGGTTTTPGGGGTTTTGGGGSTVTVTPSEAKGGGGNGETGGVGPGDAKNQGKNQQKKNLKPPPLYQADGTPTVANPSTTIAPFGPAPVGVPNIVIDQFEIPPFLLPIYQACGTQYDIPWQVLASINKIETAFGTNLNVSSAGAMGWMQFIPSTWEAYGVDANGDSRKDPYNPVDAICAAARYLRAAGGSEDLRTAIFAYNHADWYVDEVLLFARNYGQIPSDLLGSLTGLTEGAHFPVAANARYADDISARQAIRDSTTARKEYGNAAAVIQSSPTRRGINIFSREGAPVVAVNDGVIKKIDSSTQLGTYIVLQDAYGNRFTYAQLGRVVRNHPVPKQAKLTAADFKLVTPPDDNAPSEPASVGAGNAGKTKLASRRGQTAGNDHASLGRQLDDMAAKKVPAYSTFKNYFSDVLGLSRKNAKIVQLREGSKVIGGTVLARVGGSQDGAAPHINFSIRPAGRGAPRIDPKPILDGWKLLEATAIYRAAGKNPFFNNIGVGAVLLMSKEALIPRVLSDPRIETYSCGRTDIETGGIDRRVLATLEYLVEKGFRLTITSLKCGHGFLTASGNVSNHSSGNAVDIAAINGIPVLGHQGPGTLTHALLETVLQLQGTMVPEELISLEDLGGPSFALSDHADHVHIGWQPMYGNGQLSKQFNSLLKPGQWSRLIKRLGQIDNPTVPTRPSKASLPAGKASKAHKGD
jgi:hypothetical protein